MSFMTYFFLCVILTNRPSNSYRVTFTNTPPSALTLLANDVLSKLVTANFFDVQVAKNLLRTFDMVGVGAFADLQKTVAYTSKLNISSDGNQTDAGITFSELLLQLINSSNCPTANHATFVEILLKFALEIKLLDGAAAMNMAAKYSIFFELNLDGEPTKEGSFQRLFNFQRFCTTYYGGVADGAQCFFTTPTVHTWNDSWAACSLKGANLAQIHTSSEFKKISALPKYNLWLAAKRTIDVNDGCRVSNNLSYWYDDPQTFNPRMVLNNTFGRVHRCDYKDYNPIWQCMGYNGNLYADSCTSLSFEPHALCQISSLDQLFVLISETCLAEMPIETAVKITLAECREKCRLRRWCRSFNYLKNSNCQLFTWSLDDQPKLAPANGIAGIPANTCDHYTYVP